MLLILVSFSIVAWLYSQRLSFSINEQWAKQQAEQQVQFDKQRTLQPLIKEISLARKLAAEPAIINMARNENDPELKRQAIEVLENYRNQFRDHSYFAAFAKTGHYYFNDATNQFYGKQLRHTLTKDNPVDEWYFATMASGKNYHVNVDKDVIVNVTKVWINVLIKNDNEVLGVIGTGIDITEFLNETVDVVHPGIYNLFIDRDLAIQLHPDAKLIDYNSIVKAVNPANKLDAILKEKGDIENLRSAMAKLETSTEKITLLWVNFKGEKQLLGVTYLPELGWFDLTIMNTKSLSAFERVNAETLLLGLFILTALMAVWTALHYWVLSPIAKLQSAMDEIGHGKFDTNPPLVGTGEVLQLSIKFKNMFEFVQKANLDLEETVKQRTKLLQTILDNAPFGIWMADVMGKIEFVNKTFCNSTGISEQTFLQANHYSEVLSPSNATSCLRSDKECITQLEGPHFSTEWMTFVDGKDHLLDITKVKVLMQDGSVKGIIGLASDITERTQAEQLLIESKKQLIFERNQLTTLVKTIPDLIWLKDVDGNYLNCNPRFESFFGAKLEDIIGKTDYDFVDKALADTFRMHDKAAMQANGALVNEEQVTFLMVTQKYWKRPRSQYLMIMNRLLAFWE